MRKNKHKRGEMNRLSVLLDKINRLYVSFAKDVFS